MVRAAQPEVVVVMPCGYDVPRSYEEAIDHAQELRSVDAREVVAVDAKATFSRPGPRLVDGLELLAHTLHPELVDEPVHAAAGRPLTVELP
jgi:iron complex transport system substrate-binding protein